MANKIISVEVEVDDKVWQTGCLCHGLRVISEHQSLGYPNNQMGLVG